MLLWCLARCNSQWWSEKMLWTLYEQQWVTWCGWCLVWWRIKCFAGQAGYPFNKSQLPSTQELKLISCSGTKLVPREEQQHFLLAHIIILVGMIEGKHRYWWSPKATAIVVNTYCLLTNWNPVLRNLAICQPLVDLTTNSHLNNVATLMTWDIIQSTKNKTRISYKPTFQISIVCGLLIKKKNSAWFLPSPQQLSRYCSY